MECNNLILAYSNPWYDGLRFYFAKEEASRSYLICARLKEEILIGNYISVEESTTTFRNYKDEYGEKYLIIGEVIAKWSAQDYLTFDEIPYIGKIIRNKTIFI